MPPLPSSSPIVAPKGFTRSCWECQRRRRHCDRSRPQCHKCLKDGTECPGYEEKKPVTWLAPGTVLSRPRRRELSQRRPHITNIPEHANMGSKLSHVILADFKTIPKFEWVDETTTMMETLDYCKSIH